MTRDFLLHVKGGTGRQILSSGAAFLRVRSIWPEQLFVEMGCDVLYYMFMPAP